MSKSEDRAWKDYSERFRRETLPKLMDSAIFMAIGTDPGVFDVQMATQLGAAIMADKPLLLVVPRGRSISAHLRRVADEVIDDWEPTDKDAQERFSDAIARLGIPPR